jgi:putative PIN family toxin of toxin-antitoxin system
MARVVLDTTVLLSAFLSPSPGGATFELLQFASERRFTLVLSEPILSEAEDVLLTRKHLRKRYRYTDTAVAEYIAGLRHAAVLATCLPALSIVRDPEDNIIIATAVAGAADYLCSRDTDLLELHRHYEIMIVSPEDLLGLLR